MIQLHADVYVYSDGLTDQQIRNALFEPCRDIGETVARLQAEAGPGARICVLPEGPQTVAYLKSTVENSTPITSSKAYQKEIG